MRWIHEPFAREPHGVALTTIAANGRNALRRGFEFLGCFWKEAYSG
jgi:hypothetical protein